MAQGDYAEKLKEKAEERLNKIRKIIKGYDGDELVNVYENLNENRKQLVRPIVMPDHMYITEWLEGADEKKKEQEEEQSPYPFLNEIYTEKGERVRSKSEKILADKF